MTRIRRGVVANRRHKKVLKEAKGYYGARSRVYRVAKQAVIKAGQYAYRDRRAKKRVFRSLWIIRINAQARENGIIIHTLGIGTPAGGPIPILDENGNRKEFKKNRSGNVVTSTLDETIMNEISQITGGTFIRVENQVNAIAPLLREIDQMEKRELKSHVFSQYEDRYQVFLVIGLMLFLAEFMVPTRTKKEMVWEGRFTRD